MINIHCPVCGEVADNSKQVLFKIKNNTDITYDIVSCDKCQTVFTRFSQDININQYYDELDYTVQNTKQTIFYKIQQLEYNRVLKHLQKHGKQTLLDFGCGKGIFLSFAKAKGFSVKGVETSLPRANYAKEYFNIEVSTDYYKQKRIFNETFDVITVFHVLEHLEHPVTLLTNLIKDNLSETGIVVIETPNFDSWQSKWAKSRWMQLDVPRHLTHFTPDTLCAVLKSAGCKVLNKQTFSLHLGIMGMSQTLMSKAGYNGFLMDELKHHRTLPLLIKLIITLPFATIAEIIAALAGKGGIIRYYAIKNK